MLGLMIECLGCLRRLIVLVATSTSLSVSDAIILASADLPGILPRRDSSEDEEDETVKDDDDDEEEEDTIILDASI